VSKIWEARVHLGRLKESLDHTPAHSGHPKGVDAASRCLKSICARKEGLGYGE
jgi:hypothetical protein